MIDRLLQRIYPMALLCLLMGMIAENMARAAPEQYLVINVAPGDVNRTVFEEIGQLAEERTSGSLALGIGTIFSYLNQPMAKTEAQLHKFLSLSVQYNIPVVVQLDGEQWWGNRPDLWNWWDPTRPGYNPENRNNVEWSGWGPEYAIKIAWRNWGRQIRVLPPPNFMSQRYREACHDEMNILVPLILKWWQELPQEKKHLLIGIKVGWESAIGMGSFYYPNGNALLDQSEKEDPTTGTRASEIPGRGVTAIGYAAVTTARLANGGELQEDHLAEIVRLHLADLCALATTLGVPRAKLFTHSGGWKEDELLYDAARNQFSCPGWSFYRYASDPKRDKGVTRALGKSDAPYWAAVEWLLPGKHDAKDWQDAIETTLSDPKCRYMCIYNWRSIKDNQAAHDAIQRVMAHSGGKSITEMPNQELKATEKPAP